MTKVSDAVNKLLQERYYLPNEDWQGLCKRVAKTFSGDDVALEEKIYNIILERKALFASPSLMNAGARFGMLSSCFVYDMEDSIEGIWDAAKDTAVTFKKGGGVGYDISKLRPKNSAVESTGGKSSGPLSLGMGILDQTAESVKQGGLRKGALMVTMRVDHPDIEEFISSKDIEGKYSNCNISVVIPNSFMEAVAKDANWDLKYNGEVFKTVKATVLMDKIAKHAWDNGEPGVIFIDTVNKHNFVPNLGQITHSNPCVSGNSRVKIIRTISINGSTRPVSPAGGNRNASDITIIQAKQYLDSGESLCILSMNEGSKELEYKNVVSITKTRLHAEVFEFKTLGGKTVIVTADHRILTSDGQTKTYWKRADEFKYGDVCCTYGFNNRLEGGTGRFNRGVMSDKFESLTACGYEDVYDISVEGNHNFLANDVLVHNCGEYFSIPFGSCNLASINLASFIDDSKPKKFRFEEFKSAVRIMTRALDNGIDINKYPIEKVTTVTRNIRPIGLGVMGLADVLIANKVKYSSDEGRRLAKEILEVMAFESISESIEISKEKGSFPAIKDSLWDSEKLDSNEHLTSLINNAAHYTTTDYQTLIQNIGRYGVRNSHTTVIAPTGSISNIAGDFSIANGIEPFFKMKYNRRIVTSEGDRWEEILAAPAQAYAISKGIDGDVALPDYFEDSSSIGWEDHIKMQAALQSVVANGISKTINMPNNVTVDDVKNAYKFAWKSGCKGLTIYREGSREKAVLVDVAVKTSSPEIERVLTPWGTPIPTKVELNDVEECERYILVDYEMKEKYGKNSQMASDCSKLYVYVTLYDGQYPIEIVTKFDAETKDEYVEEMKYRSLICRFISLMLRYGVPLEDIIKHLQRTSGNLFDFSGQLAKIFTKYLNEYIEDNEIEMNSTVKKILRPTCEQCGSELIFNEGCFKCSNNKCGNYRCG